MRSRDVLGAADVCLNRFAVVICAGPVCEQLGMGDDADQDGFGGGDGFEGEDAFGDDADGEGEGTEHGAGAEGLTEHVVRVNFKKTFPIFPLEKVTLLPQQALPLHIFEARYRQMVDQALDGAGQIAMAVLKGRESGASWDEGLGVEGLPEVLPAACLGQIVHHEKMPDGRYNIVLHGICRVRILGEESVEQRVQKGILYRTAWLNPVGSDAEPVGELDWSTEPLEVTRAKMGEMLDHGPLAAMRMARPVLEYLNNEAIPTSALLELVGFALVQDAGVKYRLLEESDVRARAVLVMEELKRLEAMIRRAQNQRPEDWPRGTSFN